MSIHGSTSSSDNGARCGTIVRRGLRQRASDHPMVLFSLAGACAFAIMLAAPAAGPVLASTNPPHPVIEGARTTVKTARLPGSTVDFACKGQNWGDEDSECLRAIAEQSGKPAPTNVRMIAAAEPGDAASLN